MREEFLKTSTQQQKFSIFGNKKLIVSQSYAKRQTNNESKQYLFFLQFSEPSPIGQASWRKFFFLSKSGRNVVEYFTSVSTSISHFSYEKLPSDPKSGKKDQTQFFSQVWQTICHIWQNLLNFLVLQYYIISIVQCQMFLKPVWNNQTYALNVENIQTTNELFLLLKKIYNDLPKDFLLRIPTPNGEIFIQENSDFNEVRSSLFNRCKAFIELKHVDNFQPHRELNLKKEEPSQKFETKQAQEFIEQPQQNPKIGEEQISLIEIEQKEQQKKIVFICCLCESKINSEILYRCSVCEDMDICQQCEANFEHLHPFVKIRDPQHRNLKIFAVIKYELENVAVQEENRKIKEDQKQKSQAINQQSQKNKKEQSFFSNIKSKFSTLKGKLWHF